MTKDQAATTDSSSDYEETIRIKKKVVDFKDVRKGGKYSNNEFLPRKSILDQFYLDS